MASVQALSAASQDRKTRLAQLKSLKRKQPDEPSDSTQDESAEGDHSSTLSPNVDDASNDVTSKYLSGRNYDFATKNAKLGFEEAPSENQTTLERKAAELALQTKAQAEEEAKDEKPLDLFKLQPKKPNWDLKRDLERKLDVLNVRTENAVARLVRERILGQQKAKENAANGDGEKIGIEGATLVEATNLREKEVEEEARREREEDAALLDGS